MVAVAAGFLSCFTLFGFAYSFGAFFKPVSGEFAASREATSPLFSIAAFVYFGLGPFTGRISDRPGPGPVVLAAAVAMGGGLLLTSTSTFLILFGAWMLSSVAMFALFVYLMPFARGRGAGEVAAAAQHW